MSAIINALFGSFSSAEEQSPMTNTSGAVTENIQTSVVADNVQVNSVISSDTQANASINTNTNMENLLSQINTTHAQVDEYSRTRVAEINEQVRNSIADVLKNTQRHQEELLTFANQRHLIIDNEYKVQLKRAVQALDAVKAKTLADLERDLQVRQQKILNEAKKQIDLLNNQANADKLNVLIETQLQNKENIQNLTDQVLELNQQQTQHLLESTTTTIITSHAQATTPPINPIVAAAANVTLSSSAIDSIMAKASEKNQNKIPPVQSIPTAVTNTPANINPIVIAANVTLSSSAIDSVIAKAGVKKEQKTSEVNTVNHIATAANVALNSNIIESIVNNARERSKKPVAEPIN
ncbi:unnamed protein product [Adineta ricciae]|uniref:Uncharacterized protein n=1 Tax=Adineta ricciae TaxID=249248 RepID=A0A814HBT9_ADIRI|nr:unnamed protein product [Adineta ricciae]CAF1160036.1 unnamed protein product [Adineta ricciae]